MHKTSKFLINELLIEVVSCYACMIVTQYTRLKAITSAMTGMKLLT